MVNRYLSFIDLGRESQYGVGGGGGSKFLV